MYVNLNIKMSCWDAVAFEGICCKSEFNWFELFMEIDMNQNQTRMAKLIPVEFKDSRLSDEHEKIIQESLPVLAGLMDSQSDSERNAIFEQAISKSFAAFVAENGDPFGCEAPVKQKSSAVKKQTLNKIPAFQAALT